MKHVTPLKETGNKSDVKKIKKGNNFRRIFSVGKTPPTDEVNVIGLFGPEFSTDQFKVVLWCQPFWVKDIRGKLKP